MRRSLNRPAGQLGMVMTTRLQRYARLREKA